MLEVAGSQRSGRIRRCPYSTSIDELIGQARLQSTCLGFVPLNEEAFSTLRKHNLQPQEEVYVHSSKWRRLSCPRPIGLLFR